MADKPVPPSPPSQGYAVDDAPARIETDVPTEPVTAPSPSSPEPPSPAPSSDPDLVALRALFPSTSDDILDAVLHAHSNNLQAATETLLDMNNPEFKSSTVAHGELEQVDLDAELARQLAEEDERQYRQRRRAERDHQLANPPPPPPPAPLTYQAYVPKRRRDQPQSPGSGQGSGAAAPHGSWVPPSEQQRQAAPPREDERDELDMLAENFSKLAEQGKKSFGSFMSRMKEQVGKIDEIIQQTASPSMSSPSSEEPPRLPPKSSSSYGSARTGAQWTAPEPLPRPRDAPPRTSSIDSGGGAASDSVHPERSNVDAARVQRPDSDSPIAVKSYVEREESDGKPLPFPEPSNASESAGAKETKETSPAADKTEETTPTAPKDPRKDFSKIGLLPRRSVSLLDDDKLHRSSAAEKARSPLGAPTTLERSKASDRTGVDSESDDDLEYVRNPFDED
ncbi:hypothetical protein JCM10212_001769 [Sporobolomyces blumeae]